LGSFAALQDARAHRDQLVHHGVAEHDVQRAVHVPHRPRRQLAVLAERPDAVADVARPHLLEPGVADRRQGVEAKARSLVLGR
jgi:hypothetical protein